MTDELDEIIDNLKITLKFAYGVSISEHELQHHKQAIQALIAKECTKARIEAFDVAFDCHDYDRLRAYRAELLKEVK